ncbi:hypothetical protein CPB84DRAFT_1678092, partial [Gymnopilus junonius]
MPQQTPPLDHSQGRAFISDGDIYYSPNCSRSVTVPNRNPSYPFAVGATSLRRHQTPEWWTNAFGFLSFTPTWCYLEDVLIVILHILREKFFLRLKPYFLPPPPSLLGFDQVFFSAHGARYRIGRARDWFIVWIGLLSFYIACIEGEPDPLQVPDWFNFLASEKEVDHILPELEFEKAREAYIASKPWEPFFAAQKIINDRMLANETPQDREARLSRERKNPTVSAEVFVWDWSIEEDMCLVRTRVHKKECEDNLAFYRGSQAHYDSFQNEWDLCEYF